MAACGMQRFIKRWQRNNGVDDETYRSFLKSVTGKESTTGMTQRERWKVVEELKARGVKFEASARRTAGGEVDATQDQDAQSLFIRHQWLKLKNYGVLRDSSEWALLSYVEGITKRKRLEWCNPRQRNVVAERLKKWVGRIEQKLIAEAVASGALPLPAGYASLEDVERDTAAGSAVGGQDALCAFHTAAREYLDSFKPAKARAA